MSAALLVIMALAAFRLWRLIAKDHWPPAEWFRDRIQAHLEGLAIEEGTDLNHWALGNRARRWEHVQTLMLCPWCLGAYLSAAVVSVTTLFESVPLPFLQWLAVSALVGLIAEAIDQ